MTVAPRLLREFREHAHKRKHLLFTYIDTGHSLMVDITLKPMPNKGMRLVITDEEWIQHGKRLLVIRFRQVDTTMMQMYWQCVVDGYVNGDADNVVEYSPHMDNGVQS